MAYVIENVRIFDGSGTDAQVGSVRVVSDRITAVMYGLDDSLVQAGDTLIKGEGRFLMPGMVEAHAHLSWPSSVEKTYHQFVLPPDEMKIATWRNARILLDYGFTSAYSAGALGESLEVDLREEIKAGITPGPRLVASTIERSPEGDEGVETGDVSHGRGAEAMLSFVDHCKEIGIDSVKILISGEDALKAGTSQEILYTEEELAAANAKAKEHGLWLAAHTQAAEAIKLGIKHGVRVFYHCSYADDEALQMLEDKKDEIFVAPAIGIIVATLEANPPPHVDMSNMKAMAPPVIENTKKLIPELKRRGVRVLPGGDYGFPFNPNGTNARDLEHFVNLYGYTPAEALKAATKFGGEIMGMGEELGLIKPGYLADMLLVDGDPLSDVRVLQDKDKIVMVMKGGDVHRAPEGVSAQQEA